ncbi:MAG: GNAT family N-acetyltransferase [Saprospiraceae bacterium]|nr:GNAT family N-acetyltransferase [Saprospiraceae bacterium]
MNFEIQVIKVGELEAFVRSQLYRTSRVIPITPARAVSHARNPRAKPDDVALLLAVSDDQMLGYLGAVTEQLQVKNGQVRVGWLSCLWVSPLLRGKGMATRLLREMTEHWRGYTILTEFAPDTRRMYERSGLFMESEPVLGVRGYLRPNLTDLLPPRRAIFGKIKPVLHLADYSLDLLNQVRLKFVGRKPQPEFRYLTCLDEQHDAFIRQWNQKELAQRDAQAINWFLQYPWIIQSTQPDSISKRYHFSLLANDFQQKALEIFDEKGNTRALAILGQRDRHLRLVAAWFDPNDVKEVANLIAHQMLAMNTAMFTCYHPLLSAYFARNKSPFFAVKPMRRTCMVSNELMGLLPTGPLVFQDGDGDVGFT